MFLSTKRILIIDPGKVSESWYAVREMPSLSLGCIGTYLKSKQHIVKIIDMATYKINDELLKQELIMFMPDIVGITSSTFNILDAYQVAKIVKEVNKDIFTVIGGAHATALPELTLAECPYIDTVVVGEGEIAMEKLCHQFKKGVVKEEYIQQLDQLPMVDWALYDLSKYKKLYSIRFDAEVYKFTLSLTRGCPFQCKFCFRVFGDTARTRSAENVFAEIIYNYEKFDAKMFYIADSTVLLFKENIHNLCQLIINSGIKISLIVQSRADTVDRKSIELLKEAGCETFFIGAESGNNDMLKRCGKYTSKKQIIEAVKLIHEVDIPRIRCSFIVGLEGDTRETIRQTIEFAEELKTYGMNRASVHCLDVYPGSPYWYMLKKRQGNLKLRTQWYDWASYSRLYPMTSCGDIGVEELKKFRDVGKALFEDEF